MTFWTASLWLNIYLYLKIAIMKNIIIPLLLLSMNYQSHAQEFPKDIFPTSKGDITITFIGHASIMFLWNDMIIYADPVMREADFTQFPEADVIILTHHHGDHLDRQAIDALMKDKTWIIMTETCSEQLSGMDIPKKSVITAWDEVGFNDLVCQAIPAYNIE
ncbi:MAG: MBL fold metallo-hydrolase, partial [Bacteroidales bacterium]